MDPPPTGPLARLGPVTETRTAVALPVALAEAVIAHARRAWPEEACGILAGSEGRPVRVHPMTNADRSPTTYRLDAWEQLAVFAALEAEGLDLYGIYHSHPRTAAHPSEADVRLASYPEAHHLIVSLADAEAPELRCYRIADGAVTEVEVEVVLR